VNLLFRLIFIPLGYIAAILAASGFIAAVAWLRAYGPVAGDPAAVGMTAFVVLADWVFLYALIGYLAALPALAAIAAAEIFSLRGALYFYGAGLAVAYVVSLLVDPEGSPAIPKDAAVMAGAGIAGGLAYWITCGKWSGLRSAKEPAPL
jgi:hypothetical protein